MGKRRMMKALGPHGGVTTSRIVVSRELIRARRRLHYMEAGMGSPIILIHGLGGSGQWWFPLLPQLTSDNFRVLCPDLPGFGRSSGPVLDFNDAAKAIVEFADRLAIDRFFICGHSMGGAIAAHVAADYSPRVRRLVLIDSAGMPGSHSSRALGRALQPWSWCPLHFYPTLIRDFIRAGPATMLRATRSVTRADIRPQLRRVRAATLVIWGEKDGLTPPGDGDRLVAELPDARIVKIAGARHLPMISHPGEVAKLVVGFFVAERNG